MGTTNCLPILALGLALTSLTLSHRPAQAAAFTNGSFELGPDPGAFLPLPTGSTDLTGWTVTSGNVDYIGSSWQASDGSRSLDLSGAGAGQIGQTFDTIAVCRLLKHSSRHE